MDELTVQMARAGDRAAQGRLLQGLQDRWYRLCLGLLGRGDLAAEAVQECAVRLLGGLRGWRGEGRISTWALGIAINVAREMRRRPRLVEVGPANLARGDDGVDGASAAERAESAGLVRALLAELPERQREAVLLRYFEDLSIEETAAAMRCAPGTVKATVFEAMRKMREALREKV